MSILGFMSDLEVSPMRDFWRLDEHDIPSKPGVYLLVARGDVRFPYPNGRSPIFYIGQSCSLRRRLREHLKWAKIARDSREEWLYWPRYEYAAAFGGRYCFVKTWQGFKPKALEDKVMALFARKYYSFPAANAAGAWRRVHKEFSEQFA